jgi:hypothetical protein
MIPAQSTRDDATTNARVRRADQRGSDGAGSDKGAEIGKGEAVTDGSFGVCRSAVRSAVLWPVGGSALFKVRLTENAKRSRIMTISALPRGIRRQSPTGCHRSLSPSLLCHFKVVFEAGLPTTPQRLNDECPDRR